MIISMMIYGGTTLEINLTLTTIRNPRKIKGFDSIFGAIIDGDNNLVCLAPVTHIELIFDCLTAKAKKDISFKMMARDEEESVFGRVCSSTGCLDEIQIPMDSEKISDDRLNGSGQETESELGEGASIGAHAERGRGVVIIRKRARGGSNEAA